MGTRTIERETPTANAREERKTTGIQTMAVLAGLKVNSWGGTVTDKKVTEDVAVQAGASHNAGRYVKNLLPPDVLKKVKRAAQDARKAHYKWTMPWDDDGYRLLPVSAYENYRSELDQAKDELLRAKNELIKHYDTHVQASKSLLGKLFNIDEYPSSTDLVGQIDMNYTFKPVPDSGHFVVNLGAREDERIRREQDKKNEENLREAIASIYERLGKTVWACQERLTPGEDGEEKIFRDTILSNMRETAVVAARLNLTGDQVLTNLCNQVLNTIDGVEADHLRRGNKNFDPAKREQVTKDLADLSVKFAGYFETQPIPHQSNDPEESDGEQ